MKEIVQIVWLNGSLKYESNTENKIFVQKSVLGAGERVVADNACTIDRYTPLKILTETYTYLYNKIPSKYKKGASSQTWIDICGSFIIRFLPKNVI